MSDKSLFKNKTEKTENKDDYEEAVYDDDFDNIDEDIDQMENEEVES